MKAERWREMHQIGRRRLYHFAQTSLALDLRLEKKGDD